MGIPAPAYVAASGLPPAGDQANAVLSGTILAVGPTQPFAFRGPMNLVVWASINSALTTTAGSLSASVASATGLAAGAAIASANAPRGATIGALVGTAVTLALPPITLPGVVSAASASITGLPRTAGLLGAAVSHPLLPAGTTVTAIVTPAVEATANLPSRLGAVAISALPTGTPANTVPPQFFTFTPTGNAIVTTGADAAALFTGAAITFAATIQIERTFDGGATWIVCNIGAGTLAQFSGATVTPLSITFGEPEKNVLYRLNCLAFTSGVINYRISQTGGAAESLAVGPLSGG